MKKNYMIFAIGMLMFLAAGCGRKNKQEKTISRQTVVLEHDKYDDFGSIIFKDLEDTINRVVMYDDTTYNYIEIGDTLPLEMTKKVYRKEYNKHNMMTQEEMVIDPGSKLRKKNELLKNDSLTNARRELLRKQLEANPIQIVASKAEHIRK